MIVLTAAVLLCSVLSMLCFVVVVVVVPRRVREWKTVRKIEGIFSVQKEMWTRRIDGSEWLQSQSDWIAIVYVTLCKSSCFYFVLLSLTTLMEQLTCISCIGGTDSLPSLIICFLLIQIHHLLKEIK